MKNNLIKKCIAEFVGTFALVFFGCGSMILHQINPNAISVDSIPIIFGLIVAAMIYALGHVSGAHFNPAVSVAFYQNKSINILNKYKLSNYEIVVVLVKHKEFKKIKFNEKILNNLIVYDFHNFLKLKNSYVY